MLLISRITSDRGSIFLETAISLPIYFVLLGLLVDVPAMLSHRQGLVGVARLTADVRARNNGDASIVNKNLCQEIFFGPTANVESIAGLGIAGNDDKQYSNFAGFLDKITSFNLDKDGGLMSAITAAAGSLLNGISGNTLEPYFFNVVEKDQFFRGAPMLSVDTILPREFYSVVYDLSVNEKLQLTPINECWQPGADTAQYTGTSPFSALVDHIKGAISGVFGGLDEIKNPPDINVEYGAE